MPGLRNTPGLTAIAGQETFFWDGRASSLAQAVIDPLLTDNEHGFQTEAELLERVRALDDYDESWRTAFATPLSKANISQLATALAAFVQGRAAKESPFDLSLRSGLPEHALPPAARRGRQLFVGRAGCGACHTLGPRVTSVESAQYHALGIGLGERARRLPELAAAIEHLPLQARIVRMKNDPDLASLGRYVITLDPADIGRFRTPSLYDVAVTAPYMHDGSVATLRQAVEYEAYYRNTKATPLSPEDVDDIVAFLRTLTRTVNHGLVTEAKAAGGK